jgi:hypothetical protein
VALAGVYLLGHTQGANPGSSSHSSVVHVGFEPATIDLGALPWNTTVPFTAGFVNRGDSALVIKELETSCGCLLVREDYRGATVRPGENIQLEGSVDTEYRVGPAVRTVTLTASPDSAYELSLSFEVRPTYRLSPERLRFTFENPSPQDLLLTSEQGVELVHVVADKPWVLCTLEDRAVEIDVDWAFLPPGEHHAALNVYTTDAHVPGVQVPLTAQRPRTAYLAPAAVYLFDDEHRVVRVCGVDEPEVTITRVQALPATVTAELNGTELRLRQAGGARDLNTPVYVDLSDGSQLAFMLYY